MRPVLALWLSFCCVIPSAFAEDYELGVHYQQLPIAVDTATPGQIEVVEVFSYGCVHCFDFEPTLAEWRGALPSDVGFRRLPAIFSEQWSYLAQVYYAAEVLGVTDRAHEPLFEAVHLRQADLRDPNVLAEVFEAAGVSGEELVKVLNSFGVRSRVPQADAYGRMYRVTGVPSLVVNGKYLVDGKMAGNNTRMLQVVDYLVARERGADAPAEEPATPGG